MDRKGDKTHGLIVLAVDFTVVKENHKRLITHRVAAAIVGGKIKLLAVFLARQTYTHPFPVLISYRAFLTGSFKPSLESFFAGK